MKDEFVHIVCLDAPSPPDYGGAIDMYYKIVALHSIGKKIILHYFNYKENRNAAGLEPFCEEINVYKRSVFLKSLLTLKPHIVASRIEPELIHRLNRDNYPVLLEGIHCSGIIPHLNSNKKIVVRMHNNEAEYYQTLYNTEPVFARKLYYLYESVLLEQYQKKLSDSVTYAFISASDKEVFTENYHYSKQKFIPCFIPWQNILSKTGRGDYCLYHGNLSVSENRESASWLIENVFSKLKLPLIVAGKNATKLQDDWPEQDIQFIDNPSEEELKELIQNAQIHVLPSMNATGVKLKLLHALFEGRFCISNYNGMNGTGIENHILHAETAEEWIQMIQQKFSADFTNEMIEERTKILSVYDNLFNAEKLNALLTEEVDRSIDS
jgi:hypothetical protein